MWKRWLGGRSDPRPMGDPTRDAVDQPPPGSPEAEAQADDELLDRIARATVKWGMSVPAIFLLESSKPLNFVGSQFLHFLSPIVHTVLNARDLDRLAVLLERRETVEDLIRRIEKAEAAA